MSKSAPLIFPKTDAETIRFELNAIDLPARLSASGLAGAEAITLFAVDGQLAHEKTTPLYLDGAALALKATAPLALIDGPGVYEAVKPVTASASALFLAKG